MSEPINLASVLNKYIMPKIAGVERISIIALIQQILTPVILGEKEIDEVQQPVLEVLTAVLGDEEAQKAWDEIKRVIVIEKARRFTLLKRGLPLGP